MRGKWFIVPLIALPLLIGGAWMWDRDWVYPYVALILPIDAEPAAAIPELVLEEKIALGDVKGRIDHLAIDLKRGRLFIAELGNNSVGVVDLKNHRAETRLTGFVEPQGIAYVPGPDKVFIANAGDGTVSFRSGHDLSQIKQIALGDDADNIRLDGPDRVIVGYGSGGLVVLDGASGEKLENISLAAHPESFQIDPGDRVSLSTSRKRSRSRSSTADRERKSALGARPRLRPIFQWHSIAPSNAFLSLIGFQP